MSEAIAITNVRVFDGNALTEERTMVIENGVISNATTADTAIDGQHGTLLPGLIDSHVHLSSLANLEQGTQWGVTTMLVQRSPLSIEQAYQSWLERTPIRELLPPRTCGFNMGKYLGHHCMRN